MLQIVEIDTISLQFLNLMPSLPPFPGVTEMYTIILINFWKEILAGHLGKGGGIGTTLFFLETHDTLHYLVS